MCESPPLRIPLGGLGERERALARVAAFLERDRRLVQASASFVASATAWR